MRIVHVISNLDIGGAEGALCTLVEADRHHGHQHIVISMLSGGVNAERLRRAGARVVQLSGTRSIAMAAKFRQLARILKDERPDVIQAWMYHANLAVSLARLGGYVQAPIIWGVRQSFETLVGDKPLTVGVVLAGALLRRVPHAVIYNSSTAAKEHEAYGYPPARRVVIPNIVDGKRFAPDPHARQALRSALGLSPHDVVVGRVGRYARMKDSATLFAAFALVREQLPQAILVTAGKGFDPGTPEIAQLQASHKLAGAIKYLGARPDIEKVYPAFDVLVSTSSDREGFPNVIAEAQACGVPTVGTDVGETRLIIGDNRRVFRPRDPGQMADGVLALLKRPIDERQRMGAEGRARVQDLFGPHKVVSEFVDVWRTASGRATRTSQHHDP